MNLPSFHRNVRFKKEWQYDPSEDLSENVMRPAKRGKKMEATKAKLSTKNSPRGHQESSQENRPKGRPGESVGSADPWVGGRVLGSWMVLHRSWTVCWGIRVLWAASNKLEAEGKRKKEK